MFGLTPEIGIDLGTTNILVYVKGKGIVIREPSVVAVANASGKILAIGEEARLMLGRTPGTIIALRPLADGVIADYTTTKEMLRYLIRKALGARMMLNPKVVVCVPSGVTDVERRAVLQAAREAGARRAYPIEEPMAAALGAGLSIDGPTGNMVVDIGGGTTDVAVISLSGIVVSSSLRLGGNKIDEVIARHMKINYNLMIGERTAEAIKIKIGSAFPLETELMIDVRGRDMVEGLPKTVQVTSQEIRSAIAEPVNQIVECVKSVLEKTPPELSSDIIERGITMTGGGALLKGLDKLLAKETHIPVQLADDPLSCVAVGTGLVLDEIDAIAESVA